MLLNINSNRIYIRGLYKMFSQAFYFSKFGYVLSCLLLIGGCVTKKPIVNSSTQMLPRRTPVTSVDAQVSQVSEMSVDESYLDRCLNDADLLTRSNKKYKDEVAALYKTIDRAKYYASVSSKVSKNVSMTATPLYEFKVHDMCNKISVLVLSEMKEEVEPSIRKRGGK